MTTKRTQHILAWTLALMALLFQSSWAQTTEETEKLVEHFKRLRTIGQLQASVSNLENISTALSMYKEDHSRYPNRLQDLTPEYLRSLPEDPLTSKGYRYRKSGKGYEISRIGEAISSPKILKGYPKLSKNIRGRQVYYGPNKAWPTTPEAPNLENKSPAQMVQLMKAHDQKRNRLHHRRRVSSQLCLQASQILPKDIPAGMKLYQKALRVGLDNPVKEAEIKRFIKSMQ